MERMRAEILEVASSLDQADSSTGKCLWPPQSGTRDTAEHSSVWMALKYARLRGRDRNAVPEITNAQAATDDARPIFQKAFFNPKSPLDGFATP